MDTNAKFQYLYWINLSVCDPIGISINGIQNLDKMIITQDLSYHYSYGNYMMSEYFDNTVIEEIKKYAGNVFKFFGNGELRKDRLQSYSQWRILF